VQARRILERDRPPGVGLSEPRDGAQASGCQNTHCKVGQAIRLPEFALRAQRGRGELRSAAGRRIACPTNTIDT
jgi:hypothetical protein